MISLTSPPSPEYSRDASLLERRCAWCSGPIPRRARRDARHCGTPCRQAAHRFGRQMRARAAVGRPLRFAYADPPYPRMSRLYRDHPDYGGEVDHAALVGRLAGEYPDGWALSTSAAALPVVLPLVTGIVGVDDVRVAAWVRGERPARHWAPLSAWEPVIVYRGRRYLSGPEPGARRADALVYAARARTTDRRRVVGAKPAAFCWWMFDLLGALPGDELIDLYPGSGGVGRAWGRFASGVDRPDASQARGVVSGGRPPRRVTTWSA